LARRSLLTNELDHLVSALLSMNRFASI
jgi:hypothetical protein